ncbi:MAG: mechanosensitive ion channel family protein [Candidatus Moranbacteria bacterium]|nr:mechanosensitive ion channel family protein [Candidatus Moranbacteria bacterium]
MQEFWQNFQGWMDFTFLGNAGMDYFWAVVWFAGLMAAFKIFKVIVIARLRHLSKKTETDVDDFVIRLINEVKPPFYFLVALYFGLNSLAMNELADKIIFGVFLITIVFQAVVTIQKIIDFVLERKILANIQDKKDEKNKRAVLKLFSQIVKAVLWVVGLLLVLQNMGVDVTSLIAGLGIGGVAIAFALQGVLGDLFASFSIFLDEPFRVGDYVKAGNESGTVQKVGMRSSRIKTLAGDELVVANTDISSARVHNYGKMEKRRVSFDIGVTYETGSKKLKKIPEMVKKEIEKVENVEFGRCHFKSFGDFALIFEAVYFVDSGEYDFFMDVQQTINLGIYKSFEKEKIQFAYPTQTVYLNK